jgi:protein-S-isoprenylcysteine O-methyltransferase Ste14
MPLLAARALGEEAMLKDGLPGYRDYAARVRFRLVPGLW